MTECTEDRLQIPSDAIKAQFDVDDVLTEQVNSLKVFFEGNHALSTFQLVMGSL